MTNPTSTIGDPNDFLVKYKNDTFNLKRFLRKHPGGIGTQKNLRNCDLTKIMSQDPVHSEAALYLMQEYKVQKDLNNNYEQLVELNKSEGANKVQLSNASYATNGQRSKDIPDTNGLQRLPGNITRANKSKVNDDRHEHLVDWDKAMLPQIAALGDQYHDWVNSPVDRDLRLFAPWYLECFTKTPWWLVPVFWIPCIGYLLATECLYNSNLTSQALIQTVIAQNFLGGIFVWSFLEYSLHRFVFHMDTRKIGTPAQIFHFLLHGLHHKVPTDPNRLVFPPLPALIIASSIYQMCSSVFSYPRIVLAGGLTGYLIYDMIHYYLHYGSPSLNNALGKYLYHIKRYHYQHHFVHHDKGFGISSPLWDYVFKSDIVLRKLKYTLKW